MFDNKVPKYSKVEIKLASKDYDNNIIGTIIKTYLDSGIVISGGFLIIIEDEADNVKQSSTGHIHNLNDVMTYRTYNNK